MVSGREARIAVLRRMLADVPWAWLIDRYGPDGAIREVEARYAELEALESGVSAVALEATSLADLDSAEAEARRRQIREVA